MRKTSHADWQPLARRPRVCERDCLKIQGTNSRVTKTIGITREQFPHPPPKACRQLCCFATCSMEVGCRKLQYVLLWF
jgi:hypothetical protein